MEIPAPTQGFFHKGNENTMDLKNLRHFLRIIEENIYATTLFWKGDGNAALIQQYIYYKQQISQMMELNQNPVHDLQKPSDFQENSHNNTEQTHTPLIETDIKHMEETAENIRKNVLLLRNEIQNHPQPKILSEFCDFLERCCENIKLAMQYYEGNEASINDTVLWLSI